LVLLALGTCDTALDLRTCKLNKLGLYPLFIEFAQHLLNKNCRVTILACTAVKSYDLYLNSSYFLGSGENRS
jgi:hypothetical protein